MVWWRICNLGDAKNREVMRIGYATSVDGINWNRYPEPVIEPPHPTAWDQDGVLPGGVIKEDGIFKMWFGGGVGPLGYPPASSKWSIGYATSSDCIHWDLLPIRLYHMAIVVTTLMRL